MLFDDDIKGTELADRTLCLTYDDGPGPRTRELGCFLAAQGISATFFVIGRHAEGQEDVLRQLCAWGHVVGNHTYSHPDLALLAKAGRDVVEEVARADAVIRPFTKGVIYLRPPYGSWRDQTWPGGPKDAPTLRVAEQLRRSGRFTNYVGPITWDVDADDWKCWRCGLAVERATRRHLAAVEHRRRGIVLLHDSSEDPAQQPRNRALELTQMLVPLLKARGYRFVGLDTAVPTSVAAASPLSFALSSRSSP